MVGDMESVPSHGRYSRWAVGDTEVGERFMSSSNGRGGDSSCNGKETTDVVTLRIIFRLYFNYIDYILIIF